MDRQAGLIAAVFLLALGGAAYAGEEQDAYVRYIRNEPEFQPVRGVRAKRWKGWVYMPWRWRWSVGTGDAGGRFSVEQGINGGFVDHGKGPVAWLEKFKLQFYVDHVAGKGTLFLRDANKAAEWKGRTGPRDFRPVLLDAESLSRTRALVRRNLTGVKESPMRIAYALDDEISWGTFVRPVAWRVQKDDSRYLGWLVRYYGGARKARLVGPEQIRAELEKPLAEIDLSPLLDRMTYNDSVFANFVGALVETANEVDPQTPCGFVGGQAPSLWGGYDYAKLCRKAQFLEVYDVGSAPEIVRSLAPQVPLVSTHFRKPGHDSWNAWRHFAHGQRGMIAWVDPGWCDWVPEFAPTIRELARLGQKTRDARWLHDGIAIYYSHPSIQVSWMLDSQAHGKTWPNRNKDANLGTSHLVRKAWELLLNDAGLQYDFLAYDRVIREGVPSEYKVLILPACFALSEAEAQRIREFCARGGRVVADFMCGIFDPHGRGRSRGVLDDLFGIEHTGAEGAADFFAGRLWVETDQDRGYQAQSWRQLCGTLGVKLEQGFAVAERRLPTMRSKGRATYLNLSPLRYLVYREEGRAKPRHRRLFLGALGRDPAVRVTGDDNLEVCRWRYGDRTLLFVVQNATVHPEGRTVRGGTVRITIRFPGGVTDLVNERTGQRLGDKQSLEIDFPRREAVFLSYRE